MKIKTQFKTVEKNIQQITNRDGSIKYRGIVNIKINNKNIFYSTKCVNTVIGAKRLLTDLKKKLK